MESEMLNEPAPTETENEAVETQQTNVVQLQPLKPLTPLVDEDLLVEEVCIDGMCGVY